jgi:hypothetical protein
MLDLLFKERLDGDFVKVETNQLKDIYVIEICSV